MTIDERVRDALHAYADPIEPTPGSWDRIEARVDDPLPAGRRPHGAFALAGAVVLLIAALIAAAALRGGDDANSRVATKGQLGSPGPRIVAVVEGNRVVVSDRPGGPVDHELFRHEGIIGVAPAVDGGAVYVTTDEPGPCRGGPQTLRVPLDGSGAQNMELTGVTSLREGITPDGSRWTAYTGAIDCSDAGRAIDYRAGPGTDRAASVPPDVRFPPDTTQVAILDWSNDGTTLLVRTDAAGGVRLQLVDVATGRVTPVPRGDLRLGSFAAGPPDGSMVVVREDAGVSRLDLVARDGSLVTEGPVVERGMRAIDASPGTGTGGLGVTQEGRLFTWGGTGVSFVAAPSGVTTAIWMRDARAPSSDPPRVTDPFVTPPPPFAITNGPGQGISARGTADGFPVRVLGNVEGSSSIATLVTGTVAYIATPATGGACAGDHTAVVSYDFATGTTTRLVSGATAPVLSPNGQRLAYGITCDGVTLGLSDLTDPGLTRPGGAGNYRMDPIPDPPAFDRVEPLSFSPDSSRLLYRVTPRHRGDRYYVATLGRLGDPLAGRRIDVDEELTAATFIDQRLALAQWDGDRTVVSRYDADAQELGDRLFELPERLISLVPDLSGKHLLAVSARGALYRWSEGRGAPVVLAGRVAGAAWSMDGGSAGAPPATTTTLG